MNNKQNLDKIEIVIDDNNELIIDFNIIEVEFDVPELDNPEFE